MIYTPDVTVIERLDKLIMDFFFNRILFLTAALKTSWPV